MKFLRYNKKKIDQYYEYYLTLHQNKWSRRLHVLGQCMTLIVLASAAIYGSWLLLFSAPFVIYPFAWAGHLYFEKNDPGAWNNPFLAKISDWLMFRDIICGKIPW